VAAIVVMALVLCLGVTDVARVLVARSHARTAADAAALAAAQELALPSGVDPADVAAAYAEQNDAVLSDCVCAVGTSDATVTVSIVVDGFLLVTGSKTVTARARAVVDLPDDPPATEPSVAMDLAPGLKVGLGASEDLMG
jgi:Flp pilus assembly protein TadG